MCTSTAQFVYGAAVDPFSLIITARKYAKHRSALIFLNFLRRHKEANTLNATPKDGKKGIADLPLEVITLIWQKTLEPTEHEEKCDCWIKRSYPERCFCFEEKFNENFKCTCRGVDACACYDKWEHCLFECEPMSGFEDFMESDKTRELNWQKALHEWPAKYKPKASGKNTPLMNRKVSAPISTDKDMQLKGPSVHQSVPPRPQPTNCRQLWPARTRHVLRSFCSGSRYHQCRRQLEDASSTIRSAYGVS